jgi:uncharacterized protein YfdQ (DUF2303 family)
MDNASNIEAVIAAARTDVKVVKAADGREVAIAPPGFAVHTVSAPPNKPLPDRIVATRTFHEGDSFGHYVNRYKGPATQLIADITANKVVALLDYPEPGAKEAVPGREHTAIWPVPLSEEFKVWSAFQGKYHSQTAFLEFLEENLSEIVNPEPATVLELVKDFDAIQTVKFNSKKRLDNGDFTLNYSSDTQVKGGISLPRRLTLEMPIYLAEQPVRFDAWFRTRIEEGTLHLMLQFHRIEPVKIAAFRQAVTRVAETAGCDPQYGAAA